MLWNYSGSLRKCHMRIYCLLFPSAPHAFIHDSFFLHLANRPFSESLDSAANGGTSEEDGGVGGFNPQIHLTNCCANDVDQTRFSGEISMSFREEIEEGGGNVICRGYDEIKRVVNAVSKSMSVYSSLGGDPSVNKTTTYEYCGMDFSLGEDSSGRVTATLLEVNAPPSLDTAHPHLKHAEELHDRVHSDIIEFLVLPRVLGHDGVKEGNCGGWRCCSGSVEPGENYIDRDRCESMSSVTTAPTPTPTPTKFTRSISINTMKYSLHHRRFLRTQSALLRNLTKNNANKILPPTKGSFIGWGISKFARSRFQVFDHIDENVAATSVTTTTTTATAHQPLVYLEVRYLEEERICHFLIRHRN